MIKMFEVDLTYATEVECHCGEECFCMDMLMSELKRDFTGATIRIIGERGELCSCLSAEKKSGIESGVKLFTES